jgi:hypothetical protein
MFVSIPSSSCLLFWMSASKRTPFFQTSKVTFAALRRGVLAYRCTRGGGPGPLAFGKARRTDRRAGR